MQRGDLIREIKSKKSFLCVGLDTDPRKIPAHLLTHKDPVFEFNRQIIEATAEYAVAFKPNTAFYESEGTRGWESLQKTREAIPPGILSLADAKRGDIGNTSQLYARAFFETLGFDALTVAPYMGRDSVEPFLRYEGKWVFLLALTSNPGAHDFQWFRQEEVPLYEKVIRTSQEWADENPGNLGYVIGATRPEYLAEARKMAPDAFFLVPGVGAQGGSLEKVCEFGMNADCGLLVNSSRDIIYAGEGKDFAKVAARRAREMQLEMARYL